MVVISCKKKVVEDSTEGGTYYKYKHYKNPKQKYLNQNLLCNKVCNRRKMCLKLLWNLWKSETHDWSNWKLPTCSSFSDSLFTKWRFLISIPNTSVFICFLVFYWSMFALTMCQLIEIFITIILFFVNEQITRIWDP